MCRILTVHKVRATEESLMLQFLRKRLHFQEEVALRNTRQEYSTPGSPFDIEGGSPFLGRIYTITTPTTCPVNSFRSKMKGYYVDSQTQV